MRNQLGRSYRTEVGSWREPLKANVLLSLVFSILCSVPALSDQSIFLTSSNLPEEIRENGRLNWVVAFVPDGRFSSVLVDESIIASKDEPYRKYCREGSIFLSGGFLDTEGKPEGLLIESGRTRVDYAAHYDSGGVIYLRGGVIGFARLGNLPPHDTDFALQSKPFLWEEGSIAAGRVEDGPWDRIAIGTAVLNGEFGMTVIGVFAKDRKALRQHQFIDAISQIEQGFDLEIDWLLNLDGANTAFLRIPKADIFHGLSEPRYIPSALCIRSKEG